MNLGDDYRILFYGDSITKGVIFDQKRQRYVVLEERFTDLIKKECRGVIDSVGRFGNTISGAIEKLQHLVLKKAPDVVILEFGGNDCDFDWEEIARNPSQEHSPKTDLSLFKQKLRETIELLREHQVFPVLMSLPPLDAEKYFKWVCKSDPKHERNVLSWLETVSKIYWWHERYNAAVLQIADETNSPVIDVRGAFLQESDFRNLISIDGIHPNQFGHQIIAQKIIEYTKEKYSFLLR